ncbi:extended synaptotagmin-1 isoform X1 [Anolis sagrei]|uniref:extended synaptotagmin-1 isoform X1 n=1 Tax=Anolis sagrei TaxID=38937 RepID=UPI00295C0B2E|nr:extended synaptotagmin-1 isoform X2 [Anolis sagrei ordinatus]
MERGPEKASAEEEAAPLLPDPAPMPPSGGSRRLPGGLGSAEAMAALGAMGRRLLWLLPVYLAGRAGLSVGFVVAGVALYLGWRGRRRSKEQSLRAAGLVLGDEEAAVSATALGRSLGQSQSQLPAWVSFPDVEKAEWLNKILAQAWPFFGQYMEKLLVENIAPSIRASNTHLQTFTFSKIDMGEKPLRVIGVKVHTGQNKKQILLDLNISYAGDVQIDVEVKKFFCKAGVKGMQLHGMLRVILEPLIGNVPIVGALTMFFIRRPTLDINWTGMTNLLDIPGLSSLSDTMIMDSIASFLVLPNRLLIPLVPDLHEAAQLRSPIPRGIVRVYLMEAKDLQSKDKYIKGMIEGKSDPYAVVRVGTQVFTSKVIDENLNPKWNEMYEFIVHEVPGQELEVELFDKDPDQDDFLGRMKLDFGEVKQARVLEEWFPLQDGGRARVHLRLEWHTLMSDTSKLDQVLQWNKTLSTKPEPPSAAILVVYLDRAQELPLKKSSKEPNPMVQLSVHDVTRESKVVYNTVSPVWDDAFRFFMQDPTAEDIDIQIKDDNRQTTLGSLTIHLSRLLNADDLTLDQWFQLENSGPNSRIYMKVVMRILYLDAPEVCIKTRPCPPGQLDVTESATVGSSVDQPPRPTKASPDAEFGMESVVRIHLLEAENLIAKDNFMGGMIKGKSDPYVKVRLGGQKFRSRVIKEDLNPRWSEIYEVIVSDIPGQEVEFDLYDKDVDKDDFLGRCKIPLRQVLGSKFVDEWLPLEDVKSGRLHVKLECLPPTYSAAELEQVLIVNSLIQTPKSEELSSALLSVFLDRAADLPMRKGSKPPNPSVSLSVRGISYKTKVSSQTAEPVWDEAFSFLIKKPHTESLELQVKDDGHILGSLSLPLTQLLVAEGLVLDQWFQLNNAGSTSQILMRVQLGLLVSQHSGVEAFHAVMGEDNEESLLKGSETELYIQEDGDTRSMQELRQRMPHANRSDEWSWSFLPERDRQRLLFINLELSDSPLGQLHLTVWYNMDARKLIAIIHACRNLKSSAKDIPDPYVSLILLPDKSRVTKRKTAVRKKTLNPEFNEKFEWDLTLEEAQRRKLEAYIKNSVSFMSRGEPIGKVHIDLSQKDLTQGAAQWYDLKDDKASS